MSGHQEIKCRVSNCRYNTQGKHCTLNNITVGNDHANMEAKSKSQTECASFIAE